jgi:hypothetical protein
LKMMPRRSPERKSWEFPAKESLVPRRCVVAVVVPVTSPLEQVSAAAAPPALGKVIATRGPGSLEDRVSAVPSTTSRLRNLLAGDPSGGEGDFGEVATPVAIAIAISAMQASTSIDSMVRVRITTADNL